MLRPARVTSMREWAREVGVGTARVRALWPRGGRIGETTPLPGRGEGSSEDLRGQCSESRE